MVVLLRRFLIIFPTRARVPGIQSTRFAGQEIAPQMQDAIDASEERGPCWPEGLTSLGPKACARLRCSATGALITARKLRLRMCKRDVTPTVEAIPTVDATSDFTPSVDGSGERPLPSILGVGCFALGSR